MLLKSALLFLCAAAATAAPTIKRQEQFPTSAGVKVVTASGKYFLLHDGRVYEASDSHEPTLPQPPIAPMPMPPPAPVRRVVPVPEGVFSLSVVGGSPAAGDVLLTLDSFDGPCVLAGELGVLSCFSVAESSEPTAVFRAKRQEDGQWELLGGSKSFTVNDEQDGTAKDLSPLDSFETTAKLYLKL